jgi:hypothetical protein
MKWAEYLLANFRKGWKNMDTNLQHKQCSYCGIVQKQLDQKNKECYELEQRMRDMDKHIIELRKQLNIIT